MGRASVKENKNIYQTSREDMKLTREAAAEKLQFMSADRIEKIENERTRPHPDEVIAMADCYKNLTMANYYCTHECPIGICQVNEVIPKDIFQISLEVLDGLNSLYKQKERLVEITVDGEVSDSEIRDFISIKNDLEKMSATIDSLKLWVNQTIADGKMDGRNFKEE